MDVVSSAAAVAQLLGQAISLCRQINSARNYVRTAPAVLGSMTRQLSNLCDILQEVQHEKNLHTIPIQTQLNLIGSIADEFNRILEKRKALQSRSRFLQGLRALNHAHSDEAKLVDVLRRLEQAKVELALRINVAHVGLTGGLTEEVKRIVQTTEAQISKDTSLVGTVDSSSLQGNGVKASVHEEARSATKLEPQALETREEACLGDGKPMNDPCPTGEAEAVVSSGDKKPQLVHHISIAENDCTEQSRQINGILGAEGYNASITARILGNRATGMSRQHNLVLDASNSLQLIQSLCF